MKLDGLGDGIIVLVTPNELGETTLFAALTALFRQAPGQRQKSAKVCCIFWNTTSPVFDLVFEVAGGLHRIEKRFMHREPYARLTLPNGTHVEVDAAEEQLQSILGFGAPGRTGVTPDSLVM